MYLSSPHFKRITLLIKFDLQVQHLFFSHY